MKLAEILGTEYPEFVSFCQARKVRGTDQLTEDMYAAYRMATGYGEEYTDGIKARIADAEAEPGRPLWHTLKTELLDEYRNIPVEAIGFSARTRHFCQHTGIKTLYDLLSRKNSDLKNGWSVGVKTLHELYDYTRDFIESGAAAAYRVRSIAASIRANGNGALLDPEPFWLPLDEGVAEQKEAEEELNKLAASSPEQASLLCLGLREYYRPYFKYYRAVRDALQMCAFLPEDIKSRPAESLLWAYGLRFADNAKLLAAWPQGLSLPECLLRAAHEDPEGNPVAMAEAASSFCTWLKGLDMKAACGQIFCASNLDGPGVWDRNTEKYWEIIQRRAGGETLDGIGKPYGVTRERVRQIETVCMKRLKEAYFRCPYDLVSLMFLDAGGTILTQEQAEACLGQPAASLFWMLASRHFLDCSAYGYNDVLKAICRNMLSGTPEDADRVLAAIKSLPEAFYEDEKPSLLAEASANFSVPVEVLEEWLQYSHRRYGLLYSSTKPDTAKMCEYLLRIVFPDGYKVGDRETADKALDILSETFGRNSTAGTMRYVDNRIFTSGQQVDRGLYKYPGYVCMDYSALDDVYAYIEKSNSSVIPFTLLYGVFRESLNKAGICNRYALQGAMKRCGCSYTTTRDYVLKDEAGSMAAELSAFAKERGRFTLKDFADAFPYYNPSLLYPLASRTDGVIQTGRGLFMDASLLNYTNKEQMDIMAFIYRHSQPDGMNTDAVFAEFRMTFAPFCVRNGIQTGTALYNVLEHMYAEYFTFSRPRILAD